MGDSGSIFLGYIFGSFMLITVIENEVSIYTWIIIFGYFFADTTVTLITRLILVKMVCCTSESCIPKLSKNKKKSFKGNIRRYCI